MAQNDIITNDMIAEAERIGAPPGCIAWCRAQTDLTIQAMAAHNSEWCIWAAEAAAGLGDYDDAERFALQSDDPGYIRHWCAKAAAHRGDYEVAEWFAAQGDDPGLARRWCAEVAAIRGDYDVAERFRKKINGTK